MKKQINKTAGPIVTPAAGATQKLFNPGQRTETRKAGHHQPIHRPRAIKDVAPGKGMDIICSPADESIKTLYGSRRKTSKGL